MSFIAFSAWRSFCPFFLLQFTRVVRFWREFLGWAVFVVCRWVPLPWRLPCSCIFSTSSLSVVQSVPPGGAAEVPGLKLPAFFSSGAPSSLGLPGHPPGGWRVEGSCACGGWGWGVLGGGTEPECLLRVGSQDFLLLPWCVRAEWTGEGAYPTPLGTTLAFTLTFGSC